ncbi:atherin-like [Eublepharis macularius]|uniref:Atherin-like n=1 Tax=Eublepharis macularius TaxID=481883 RepID=A0AA97JT09_EUBMA|nr:atherin-like [Eublepharis macularius]
MAPTPGSRPRRRPAPRSAAAAASSADLTSARRPSLLPALPPPAPSELRRRPGEGGRERDPSPPPRQPLPSEPRAGRPREALLARQASREEARSGQTGPGEEEEEAAARLPCALPGPARSGCAASSSQRGRREGMCVCTENTRRTTVSDASALEFVSTA